jgi:hypothetical protein
MKRTKSIHNNKFERRRRRRRSEISYCKVIDCTKKIKNNERKKIKK